MTREAAVDGLAVEHLTVKRGSLTICRDVSLRVPAGEITVLLGANGAGKTTLLDGISGVLPATGSIALGSRRLDRLPVHRRAALGIAYVEQQRSVFRELTVAQNIAVADRSARARDDAFEMFPRLAEKRNLLAGALSGGEQQMLTIARALATRPNVLLVDELSFGLAPHIVRELVDTLSTLAEQGMAMLLVDQFADVALTVGATAHVMQRGRIVHSERFDSISGLEKSRLSQLYLGAARSEFPESP